ncbi:hypothetical protein KIH27_12440 [Mycobacterium sp. M1]|uniref:Transmembrane protein n=1 Tax=Mycolicibacter acidiphilus TaxID=2835306 RepID=A0ABS5RJB4_9MYCO|nr:hypothetical protein [Mycolicibacter acidiphilus]MBS9534393.1 hypothetical protein [Mycolicibacter acidiphilus]
MSHWFNYVATLKILVYGLLVGAALPALFAVAMRVHAVGNGLTANADGTAAPRRPLLIALSWAIFAFVLIVVIVGVLFIARDFIAHHVGWYILGAKPK